MTQILVRNLEQSVKTGLPCIARRRHCGMEEAARIIISAAVVAKSGKLGVRIARRFKKHGFKKGQIWEWRGRRVVCPARLED